MKFIVCRFNRLKSLDFLKNNIKLEELECSYNSISSFEILKELNNLKVLSCPSNKILINVDDFQNLKTIHYDKTLDSNSYSIIIRK
mgnify:CR=1 FL=1